MKNKLILFILLTFIIISCSKGEKYIKQDDNGRKILVGNFTWEEWQKEMNWHIEGYFEINPTELDKLKSYLKQNTDLTILIFAGSWCGDTKSELPKFMKLLETVEFDKYELIGVDRDKYEPTGKHKTYFINRVMTVVVLEDGKEIGRITEFPVESWEADLVEILNKIPTH